MSHNIVLAGADDRDRVESTLVAAFSGDPYIRWMLPEAEQYLVYYPELLGFLGGAAFETSSAHRTTGFEAAALWLPPESTSDSAGLFELLEEAVNASLLDDVLALLERLAAQRPAEPHWYLPVIGTDPHHRGKGYGSALLNHQLDALDDSGHIAFLESTNPRNLPLYERFGFEITGEVQIASSPTVWTMTRRNRASVDLRGSHESVSAS